MTRSQFLKKSKKWYEVNHNLQGETVAAKITNFYMGFRIILENIFDTFMVS